MLPAAFCLLPSAFQGQFHSKGGTFPLDAAYGECTAVLLHYLAGTGEADACALDTPGGILGAVEPFEDMWQVCFRDAYPFVLHGQHCPIPLNSVVLAHHPVHFVLRPSPIVCSLPAQFDHNIITVRAV